MSVTTYAHSVWFRLGLPVGNRPEQQLYKHGSDSCLSNGHTGQKTDVERETGSYYPKAWDFINTTEIEFSFRSISHRNKRNGRSTT